MADDDVLAVLHALRLRGTTAADAVAERTSLELAVVDSVLVRCSGEGWVQRHEGRLSGWTLTAEGRREGQRRLAEQLDRAGTRAQVEDAYRRFLPLNLELLSICTDWQVRRRDGREVVNDHTDRAHDRAVLSRLAQLHESARPLTGDLAAALDRFAGYPPRLDLARTRVQAGQTDWLTKPVIDSYHTVWFELHEDLLATLGRERTQEHA